MRSLVDLPFSSDTTFFQYDVEVTLTINNSDTGVQFGVAPSNPNNSFIGFEFNSSGLRGFVNNGTDTSYTSYYDPDTPISTSHFRFIWDLSTDAVEFLIDDTIVGTVSGVSDIDNPLQFVFEFPQNDDVLNVGVLVRSLSAVLSAY